MPCLQAGAGYIFHTHPTPSASMPLDAFVSSMLPDGVRASKEYRDKLYAFKKAMGIKTPVLIKNEKLEGMAHASTQNIGLPYLRYSIIRLDEDKFQHTRSTFNTHALAHEMGHVKNNHFGVDNALLALKTTTAQDPLEMYTKNKTAEYEAETDAVNCLAQCGLTDVIKANLDDYKLRLKNTFHAMATPEKEALQKCNYAQWSDEQLNTYLDNTENLVSKKPHEWQADIEKILTPKQKNDSSSWFNFEHWKIKDPARDQAMRSEYAGALACVIYQILHQRHPLGDHTRPHTHYYIYPTLAQAITYTSKGLKDCLENKAP